MTEYSRELYNSPIEVSLKTLLVLQGFDRPLALDEIRVLELCAVYGQDVGYHKNLQYSTPAKYRSFTFRGELVQEALDLLVCAGLVTGDNARGYRLAVHDIFDEMSFVGRLGGEFVSDFDNVCELMSGKADAIGFEAYVAELRSMIEIDLDAELGEPKSAIETDWLVQSYECDFWRMDGLQWMAEALGEHAAGLPRVLHDRLNPSWLKGLSEAARQEKKRVVRESDGLVAFRRSLGYHDEAEVHA